MKFTFPNEAGASIAELLISGAILGMTVIGMAISFKYNLGNFSIANSSLRYQEIDSVVRNLIGARLKTAFNVASATMCTDAKNAYLTATWPLEAPILKVKSDKLLVSGDFPTDLDTSISSTTSAAYAAAKTRCIGTQNSFGAGSISSASTTLYSCIKFYVSSTDVSKFPKRSIFRESIAKAAFVFVEFNFYPLAAVSGLQKQCGELTTLGATEIPAFLVQYTLYWTTEIQNSVNLKWFKGSYNAFL